VIFSGPNLALNQTTQQYPGIFGLGFAFKAVDGKTVYIPDNCAHTDWSSSTYEAWWKVDLGDLYTITGIKIYNRNRHGELRL